MNDFQISNPKAFQEFFTRDSLICAICHDILSSQPYGCSSCVALFCRTCLPSTLPSKCPLCRTTAELTPNGFIRFFMEKNKGKCQDCSTEMFLNQIKEHQMTCPKGYTICDLCSTLVIREEHPLEACSLTRCPLCQLKFAREALQIHLHQNCPEAHVKCRFCSTMVKRGHIGVHLSAWCQLAPKRCIYCGLQYLAKDLHLHQSALCSKRIINCPTCHVLVRVEEINNGNHICSPL